MWQHSPVIKHWSPPQEGLLPPWRPPRRSLACKKAVIPLSRPLVATGTALLRRKRWQSLIGPCGRRGWLSPSIGIPGKLWANPQACQLTNGLNGGQRGIRQRWTVPNVRRPHRSIRTYMSSGSGAVSLQRRVTQSSKSTAFTLEGDYHSQPPWWYNHKKIIVWPFRWNAVS